MLFNVTNEFRAANSRSNAIAVVSSFGTNNSVQVIRGTGDVPRFKAATREAPPKF